jgi:bla regulator protein blaR1
MESSSTCHLRNGKPSSHMSFVTSGAGTISSLVQMFVETVFWFHPLVWWIGKRIFQERERACDEEVLRLGSERRTYAQAILKVCELYLKSPLECVAG